MEKEALENYIKAGKICAAARDEFLGKIKPGMKILDIAEGIEALIERMGGRPAFPVNISINEVVAHYTPCAGDQKAVKEGDLVKIDVGAEVDGYIGDMAFTYCSRPDPLVEAAGRVLEAGINAIHPGVMVCEISEAIQSEAERLGVGLIVNLTGHTLDRYVFHGAVSIPNTRNNIGHVFQEGDVIALEPFTVQSNGYVKEVEVEEIFSFIHNRPARLSEAKQILELASGKFNGLPFAKRWLRMPACKASMALNQLGAAGAIQSYPVLRETSGKSVAQAEHTIIVMDKPLVTTR
jgi:methionyl aminopeptidase